MWPTWQAAWAESLYGPAGFYRRPEGPAGHFRTASHAAGAELAAAVVQLAQECACTAIVDVGAGRGELLTALTQCTPSGFDLHGIDVVDRPSGLADGIGWSAGLDLVPAHTWRQALVIGWELLDVVPCAIFEVDDEGMPREVHVEPASGRERFGGAIGTADREWCSQWWSFDEAQEGDRIESGRARDRFWSGLVEQGLAAGARALLAVDYGHTRADRPTLGSLTGFHRGRAVPPRPDGSMDVTAHVALDAVAAAGTAAGATIVDITSQQAALTRLGVRNDELLDPGSLGGFGWLLQQP